jgi:NAD(P)-dependent dehydrogenase (short-subunit alcohol dehydrogenase family)
VTGIDEPCCRFVTGHDDIAEVVVWLAAADDLDGATICVDGGMVLYPEFAQGG